ncbi:hypothetical protein V492_08198 [Pseudogymnoascus sp. VKM F-4246]|nr:hypothetical protein V492_08198 [Pseudogymnoascus sp. VKM F-4246]
MEGAMDPSMKQPGAPPGAKNEVKRLWITKVSLRSVATVTSLIVIGCCGASPYGNPMLLGPAGGAFLWCMAEGITLLVRRRTYKGIHPGACVGVDLILWLAVGVMSGFQVPMFLTYSGYDDQDENPGLEIAAMTFGLITTYDAPPSR